MFSGIVETIGILRNIILQDGCKQFVLHTMIDFTDMQIGQSVAVNGVCLTVTDFSAHSVQMTVVPETLRLTNLDSLQIGDQVNLERAMLANARVGGHYVQGHVDEAGKILALTLDNSNAWLVEISLPLPLKKYIVKKGFVALDGMSITVIDVYADSFTVTLIPHTQSATIAQQYAVGSTINIEVDMMGKYVESLLGVYTHDHSNAG